MIGRILGYKLVIGSAFVALAGLCAAVVLANRDGTAAEIFTLPVTPGNVVETVQATGTLEAVTTVQVGAQVSGTIQALYADFNSMVHKGQLLARIEPTALESRVEQARASVVKAQAEVESLEVALANADLQLARTRTLAERGFAAASERDAAEFSRRRAEVQLKAAVASVAQARAALRQAEVDLAKTAILSPMDGIVVSRDVDVGQTVAASMSAPTLFLLAADLARMRVNASIDESDVGRIAAGQGVQFSVDAYPSEQFTGTVAQVRLTPVVTQNVVTYQTIIDASNPELKLRPGMTALVTVETLRRIDVLRVPNAAIRFKPTTEIFALLGQTVPPSGYGAESASITSHAPAAGTAGRVWTHANDALTPVVVRLGVSDGLYTELLSSTLAEGTEVVWGVTGPSQTRARGATPTTSSPLFGRRPRTRFRF